MTMSSLSFMVVPIGSERLGAGDDFLALRVQAQNAGAEVEGVLAFKRERHQTITVSAKSAFLGPADVKVRQLPWLAGGRPVPFAGWLLFVWHIHLAQGTSIKNANKLD